MSSFVGTSGNDTFPGTSGDDTAFGLGGDDSLVGLGGADILVGGGGDDVLLGGAENDTIYGNPGNDSIDGGPGADRIDGGSGNDTMLVEGGDRVLGETGDDSFIVTGGGNVISGGGGTDSITFTTAGTYTITNGVAGAYVVTGPGGETNAVSGIDIISGAGGDSVFGAGTFYVCFAGGTRIRTSAGEVAVESLRAGDLVATVSGRGAPLKPVLWIGRRRVALAGHPNAEAIAPIRIRAGALGENTPQRDLLVSPDHCMFLDGALVPARLLVNGGSIVVEAGLAEVTYYHVELESHDVLLAEGAAAESWLDCANRSWFENADVAQFSVTGSLADAGTGWDANRACAPLLHGGETLAAIREAIAARVPAAAERAAA